MPQGDDKKSMWRDVTDQDLSATQGAPIESQGTIGPDTRGNWQRLKDYVAQKWREPAGMGSLDEPYRPGIGYGPTKGEIVTGIGSEATSLLSPIAAGSKTAAAIGAKLPQRIKATAGGAAEGYTVGSGFEKMGLPYGGRLGAIGGGLYGAITGRDPGMSLLRKAGEAWRGGSTPTPTSGPTPMPSSAAPTTSGAIVTPAQQASQTGLWHAGVGSAAPNPEIWTPENMRLIEAIKRRLGGT